VLLCTDFAFSEGMRMSLCLC